MKLNARKILIAPLFLLLFGAAHADTPPRTEQGIIHFQGAIVIGGCQTQSLGTTLNARCTTTDSVTSESITMAVKTGNVVDLQRVSMHAYPLSAETPVNDKTERYIVRLDYH